MAPRTRYLIIALICWLIAIICLFLMGCAGFRSWDTPTKVMFTGLVAGQAIDYLETDYILDHDGHERNPLFDRHQGRIIPLKIAVLIGSYYFINYLEPEHRKWFLIPANALTWGVVYHNYGELK